MSGFRFRLVFFRFSRASKKVGPRRCPNLCTSRCLTLVLQSTTEIMGYWVTFSTVIVTCNLSNWSPRVNRENPFGASGRSSRRWRGSRPSLEEAPDVGQRMECRDVLQLWVKLRILIEARYTKRSCNRTGAKLGTFSNPRDVGGSTRLQCKKTCVPPQTPNRLKPYKT